MGHNGHNWRLTMNKSIPIAEAKATFSDCIRKVETGSTVIITRHGKPVAALVRPADLEHLERLKKAGPESGLVSIAGGWENSEELAEILDESPRFGQRDHTDFEH
jgi:prevent-host-death family protein